MVESILIILVASFFVYIGFKYGRKPKEEPVNVDVKLSFSVSDNGDLETQNISLNNQRLA